MPRGRPKKIKDPEDESMSGLESLQMTIAEVIQESTCSIPGCQPRFHMEEAGVIIRKMVSKNLLRVGD